MNLPITRAQAVSQSDLNLLTALGEDGSVWYSVQRRDRPWEIWDYFDLPDETHFTDLKAAGLPEGGALLAFLSADLKVWHLTGDKTLVRWSEWGELGAPEKAGGLTNLVAAAGTWGACIAAIGLDGHLWLTRRTAAEEEWGEWLSLGCAPGAEALIDIDITTTGDGMALVGLGLDHNAYEIAEVSAMKWSEWRALGAPPGTAGLYQMTLIGQGERTTVFTTSRNAEVWAMERSKAGWGSWFAPGKSVSTGLNVTLALDGAGLIHAFDIGQDKRVWHLGQTPGGWGEWEALEGAPLGTEFTAVTAALDRLTGQIDVIGLDRSGRLWLALGLPDGTWAVWVSLPVIEKPVMRGIGDLPFLEERETLEHPEPSRRYDQCAFLVAHNAFASRAYEYLYSQQALTVSEQLERGARGLMLDIYEHCEGYEGVVLAHGGCEITTHMKSTPCEPLKEILGEIKAFLDAHPDEVLTLLFESYVSGAEQVDAAFAAAGLTDRVFYADGSHGSGKQEWKVAEQGWPSLQWLVERDRRLVVFSQRPKGGQDGLPSQWDYSVETVYGNRSMGQGCDCRSESSSLADRKKPLFVMNRFPTLSLTGSLLPAAYTTINDADKILGKVAECAAAAGRLPNFVAVDFVDHGSGGGPVRAINDINRQWAERIRAGG